MTETDSIFGANDPFELTRDWLAEAGRSEPNDPNAIALSTVDAQGMPNVRIVLLKEIEDDAFVFYTNYGSRKGVELDHSGKAAFVLHWKSTRRQVRVRGLVSREDGVQADVYFASRDLGSRLGAWASRQSHPLPDRETLEARIEHARDRFGDDPPRPPHWGGYRVRPVEFEFWADGKHRLHDREKWIRPEQMFRWTVQRLFP